VQLFSEWSTELLAPNFWFLVAGDFILSNIDWTSDTAPDDGVHDVLLHVFATSCVYQSIFSHTRIDNILDIFVSNIQSLITDYTLEDPLGTSDHVSIIIHISIPLCNDSRPYKNLNLQKSSTYNNLECRFHCSGSVVFVGI